MPRKGKRRPRAEKPTVDYADPEGNVLTLRETLSPKTVRQIRETTPTGATTIDDAWRRRTELLFERLAVTWEISGLPLSDQKLLLGRYRMATEAEQEWVRRTITDHVARFLPELND